jgi:tetratricopeptide (TPR) repeat protein
VVRYYREIDNIRAVLDWCFSPAGDTSIGTAITAAFLPVWLRFALGTEFRRRAENALAHLGDHPTIDAPRRMVLCIGLGITLIQIGARSGEALSAATESLRIADSLGEPLSQMYALWALWVVHAYRGNYRAAQPVAENFSRLATASGDPARFYLADRLMGISMHYGGNLPKAREHLDRVAGQYRRSLGRPQIAWLGHNLSEFGQSTLARVLCLQGFLDQARILAQTCIDHMQSAGEKFGLCYVLAEAACPIALQVNDTDEAGRHVTHLINAATALDLRYWITLARCLEGVVLVRKGHYEAGVAALRAALAVCDEIGGMTRYPTFLGAIASGLAGLGRTDEARTMLDQALARADRDGEEWCIPNLLCLKGELALSDAGPSSGHTETAEQCFRDAIELAQRQGALVLALRGAWHLACLRLEQKRPNDARQILAPVYGRFVEGFETSALRAAKLLLDSVDIPR